jgi:predicted O-methyltransferase YrrM
MSESCLNAVRDALNDSNFVGMPKILGVTQRRRVALGFIMSCEAKTGVLLRALAASKPGGRFLECGTGAG